jgi:hypothetical protein
MIQCLMPGCDTTAGCKCPTAWTVYATADETVPVLSDAQRRLNDALAQARVEGRIAGLEEAAKIAESFDGLNGFSIWGNRTIAKTIRAAKEKA